MTLTEMTLAECQRRAEQLLFNGKNKHDPIILFDVKFPKGVRHCEWLDASMGIFKIVDSDKYIHSDGFITVSQMYDIHDDLDSVVSCDNLRIEE